MTDPRGVLAAIGARVRTCLRPGCETVFSFTHWKYCGEACRDEAIRERDRVRSAFDYAHGRTAAQRRKSS